MSKKKILWILGILCCVGVILCACGGSPAETGSGTEGKENSSSSTDTSVTPSVQNPDPDYHIHSFYELNQKSDPIDSHTDPAAFSTLELDYRTFTSLGVKLLKTTTAYYPRLKQMADGKYILFFQEEEHGNTVWYTRSADLENWDPIQPLFPYDEENKIIYATGDAVVLSDGAILAVCAYRQGDDYDVHPERNGIVMRKSTDNGTTWSEQKIVYVGTTWEPYPMQLPTGEIQVYFTNTTCYYRTAVADASTGTAMFRSFDGGETWSTDLSRPYSAQIVSQTATRVSAGTQLFSDQMPVCVMLHNGKMLLALETRVKEGGTNNTYSITLSRSADNWAEPLAVDKAGPKDKNRQAFTGAAPYLIQFPSGEAALGYTRQGEMAFRMIDASGTKYSKEDLKPFNGKSGTYWGALERIGTHTLIAIGDNSRQVTVNRAERTLEYGKLNLLHSITAGQISSVTPDGDAAEWETNDEALFLGGQSQAQASIRCATDKDNIYFLIERLDTALSASGDEVSLYFSADKSGEYERLTVDPTGVTVFEHFNGKNYVKNDLSAVRFGVKVNGTVGYDEDTDEGYSVEVAIPRSALSFPESGEFSLYLALANIDGGTKADKDVPSGSVISDKSTWFPIKY